MAWRFPCLADGADEQSKLRSVPFNPLDKSSTCQCTMHPCCCDAPPLPAPNMHTGVVLEGYEYQRFQLGAQPFWTPLRLPGQYHDEETDLFENWNRYYSPASGRYLQPEPLALSSPANLPSYAYALNNPLAFSDPDGRRFVTNDPNMNYYLDR